ncbi:DUF2892 domain-containing protein [Acholeplasma vituli]|uniref:DUF2892 domain-containing protein n=1 Tax=Paracholeplasma vituli TaxID=69473 RepID=A0ABT2PX54_9MOLU|nr:DUF2892 domain-containing protein [Paracholeplasma vituli]MCU0105534.1 DUF2892 domain-containing protein [Paracholeplasma vituli]
MKLQKNVGSIDKLVRYGIAAVLVIVGILLWNTLAALSVVLFVFAVVLSLTALFSFCGLYSLFGINTCKLEKK